ncbi:tyrosine-type recombinase/integrase [Thiomicrorhabdus indica]|uniref:tyrosine-type recombinase/integrase n=1 Tax=Thiomicrorhabdus indica TaxID=2267253 RepID=UPI002AA8005A|nr:tyrosine-type recombinase/integrase [Thiomicrorhabdus indica]
MQRKLTDTKVKTSKPGNKIKKLYDGEGMVLVIRPNGRKIWRYEFRIFGKRLTMQIGEYPFMSLKEAREKHQQARAKVLNGIDPRVNSDTEIKPFSYYALETNKALELRESTLKKRLERQRKHLFPILDKTQVTQITAIDVLNICKPLAESGNLETAHLLATYCRQTFDTLLSMQLIETNPAESIKRLLPKLKRSKAKAFAHTTNKDEVRALLAGSESYHGSFAVKMALQLMPHVFLRPKNIRFMRWENIDLDNALITLPDEEMKMDKAHKIPLSKQALQILRKMLPITGKEEFVFLTPQGIKTGAPMSENTLNKAIRLIRHPETGEPLGKGIMTSHGFRHMASTMLNELRFDADAIELQLAHLDKDRIRRTYNKAELMEERAQMMQAWSDHLDGIKTGADVVPIQSIKRG